MKSISNTFPTQSLQKTILLLNSSENTLQPVSTNKIYKFHILTLTFPANTR